MEVPVKQSPKLPEVKRVNKPKLYNNFRDEPQFIQLMMQNDIVIPEGRKR